MNNEPDDGLSRIVQTACLPVDMMHLNRPEIGRLP